MRKLLVLLIAALTLGVCAAAASACDEAPPSGTFCVDGQTVNATGYEYYLLTFEQELYSYFEITDTSISSGACADPVMLPHPSGIFLCYSKFGTDTTPAVFDDKTAAALVAGGGYWEASAVSGNVAGGDNVGTYHMVCNHTGSWGGKYLEDDGSVMGGPQADAAAAQQLGFYKILA